MTSSTRQRFPNWPRGLSEQKAADYVGVSVNTFRAEVKAGLWPRPIRRGRRVIWDLRLIDASFDQLSALADRPSVDLDDEFA